MNKINIYLPDDIESQTERFIHQNAFILPDGKFILAKGYTGCNPSHQLESSALLISRNFKENDMREEYESFIADNNLNQSLYYLRTMLVHYYGFALFARTEYIKSFDNRNKFFDQSLVPNPEYYEKQVTPEQIITLEKLFTLNDDGTLLFPKTLRPQTSEEILKRVLKHNNGSGNWHSEFKKY